MKIRYCNIGKAVNFSIYGTETEQVPNTMTGGLNFAGHAKPILKKPKTKEIWKEFVRL